jgi:cytochrome c-type biogenesis protein CcmH/NrfG
VLREARKQLSEGQYWDAIHALEGVQDLAKGSRTNHAVRTLLARATAKNPKWQRRAEAMLLSVLKEDPKFVEAHFVLGRIYRDGGMKSRAEVQFQRVLEIYPSHREAAAELQSLKSTH